MEAIREIEQAYRKPALPQVQSGDTVRVHQVIKEGAKQRVQVFEGIVIRTHRLQEVTACLTVRRIASGVGVEKTFLLHSPNVAKIEVLRRAKVRRNFLSYQRERTGKSARLREVSFDKALANDVSGPVAEVSDEEVTEVSPDVSGDALNEAVPLDEVIKDENEAVASDDAPNPSDDVSTSDEADLAAAETAAGVDRAESEDKPA